VILRLVPPGQFVPMCGPRRPDAPHVRAVAHVDSAVAVLEAPVLAGVLLKLPCDCQLRLMNEAWRSLSRHLLERCQLPLLPLTERLLRQLCLLARDFGRPVTGGTEVAVRLTHTHLAQLVGGSRAAVCRALGALVERGQLSVIDGRFVVLDAPVARLTDRSSQTARPEESVIPRVVAASISQPRPQRDDAHDHGSRTYQ